MNKETCELMAHYLPCGLNLSKDTDPEGDAKACDCLVLIGLHGCIHPNIVSALDSRRSKDKNFEFEITVFENDYAPGGLVIYVPVSELSDYDDGRTFAEASAKGVKRCIQAGRITPLLILPSSSRFNTAELQALLGAFAEVYQPIQFRESNFTDIPKIQLWAMAPCFKGDQKQLFRLALMYETARFVTRDIASGDPERMAAPRIEEYIMALFKNSVINVTVIKDEEELKKDYPLLHAVNRAASQVERHQARVIYMEYKPEGDVQRTIFLVGKGVTYDTGGADIKISSGMCGMSRDKSGAAAVAGFMHLCNLIRPKKLRVVGAMACVRNSIGPEAYVPDEIITSRSGMKVRVINTDAEGRMAMADVLTKCSEDAANCPEPHLYTIATLTGHAELSVGLGYSVVIDNSVAAFNDHAQKLQMAGEAVGQPFEISKLRREDFAVAVSGAGKGENLVQCLAGPSTRQMRGHQYPMAFLTLVSGLDKHGLSADKPISYSHLDICGSVLWPPEETTGTPVLALAHLHLILEQSQIVC